MTNQEIAKSITLPLFADRDTIAEAWQYAEDVIMSLRESDRMAAMTALMVMNNTIAKLIMKNEEKHPLHDAFIRQTKEA